MGAGCYYTNKETRTKAFWIDTPPNEDDIDFNSVFDDEIQNLHYELLKLGYDQDRIDDYYHYSNGLFQMILESKYEGDGIVIRLEPHTEEPANIYTLGMANHERSYYKLARELNKAGYPLRIATSGYTSTIYKPK